MNSVLLEMRGITKNMNFYIGCPIWSWKGWVGNFYPEGTKPSDFLREYTRRLTTVEGNTTFYAVPAQKTLEGWMEEMPPTFRFCPKVPKAISHEGKLLDNLGRAHGFVDLMRQLGARLGPMFLQLPPRYSPKLLGDLQAFLADWPLDVRLAVEVRHLDWFDTPHNESLNELLTAHNMARVTIDTRPIRDLSGGGYFGGICLPEPARSPRAQARCARGAKAHGRLYLHSLYRPSRDRI